MQFQLWYVSYQSVYLHGFANVFHLRRYFVVSFGVQHPGQLLGLLQGFLLLQVLLLVDLRQAQLALFLIQNL